MTGNGAARRRGRAGLRWQDREGPVQLGDLRGRPPLQISLAGLGEQFVAGLVGAVGVDFTADEPVALEGVPTVLMVSASETPDRLARHTAFIDAAVTAGVEHLVYISFYGAAPDCTFTLGRDHYATEEHIRASGLRFTFLRDNLYADF